MKEDVKKRSLGRGLSALFEEDQAVSAEPRKPTRTLPVDQIHPGRYQPRRNFDADSLADLARSIREKGVLQPLLVRVHPNLANAYELVAGERRWRASQQAGLHEVPVVIRDLSDCDALEIALVENLQRQDLSPIEEAEAFARLMEEFRHTQEDLAKAVGKSRSHIANTLRLLALPEGVRKLVAEGKLSAGHARALIGMDKAEDMATEIVERGLNVRQVEMLAQRAKKGGTSRRAPAADADIVALERELAVTLGLEVHIRHRGPGGEITIAYGSLDQFDQLLKRLR